MTQILMKVDIAPDEQVDLPTAVVVDTITIHPKTANVNFETHIGVFKKNGEELPLSGRESKSYQSAPVSRRIDLEGPAKEAYDAKLAERQAKVNQVITGKSVASDKLIDLLKELITEEGTYKVL